MSVLILMVKKFRFTSCRQADNMHEGDCSLTNTTMWYLDDSLEDVSVAVDDGDKSVRGMFGHGFIVEVAEHSRQPEGATDVVLHDHRWVQGVQSTILACNSVSVPFRDIGRIGFDGNVVRMPIHHKGLVVLEEGPVTVLHGIEKPLSDFSVVLENIFGHSLVKPTAVAGSQQTQLGRRVLAYCHSCPVAASVHTFINVRDLPAVVLVEVVHPDDMSLTTFSDFPVMSVIILV